MTDADPELTATAETLRVACSVSGPGYIRHCAAMLHSLLVLHLPGRVHIHYIHGDDDDGADRTRLVQMVTGLGGTLSFHAVPDEWVRGLPVTDYTMGGTFSSSTWYRIFLPDLIPEPRVIYLDIDVLVQRSLIPLWETPLEGLLLGAVMNVHQQHDLNRPIGLGLPSRNDYFNAGVMLLDLELMRQERTPERLREFAIEHPERCGWWDQDAMNIVLQGRWLALHPRWNCTLAIMHFPWAVEYFGPEKLAQARDNPAVRHFEGPVMNKPWHLLCAPELRRMYAEHRRATPWPRVRLEGWTPANVVAYARTRARAATRTGAT